jgi:hypothetical protein
MLSRPASLSKWNCHGEILPPVNLFGPPSPSPSLPALTGQTKRRGCRTSYMAYLIQNFICKGLERAHSRVRGHLNHWHLFSYLELILILLNPAWIGVIPHLISSNAAFHLHMHKFLPQTFLSLTRTSS